MQMEVTDSGATLKGTGNATYESNRGSGVAERLASLSENIVRIDKLKVNWADIDTAVINYLTSNNVTAQNLTIVDGNGNVLATYDANGIRLGQTEDTHAMIDFRSLKLVDRNGNTYFLVSDLRDASGYYVATDTFIGDGSTTVYELAYQYIAGTLTVEINGATTSAYTVDSRGFIDFSAAPAAGDIITATYTTNSDYVKEFTFGSRGSGNAGGCSATFGLGNIASGSAAFATGRGNTASGENSHAEGDGNVASGMTSHAEGADCTAAEQSAHAEGEMTSATGLACHAEGYGTTASGIATHAGGEGTIASGNGQTAIGKYNVADSEKAVIVGNGSGANSRSNAMTLDFNGNETLAGDIFLQGGSFDVRSKINSKLDSGVETIAKATYLSDTSVFPGFITVSKQGNVIELYAAFNSSQKPTNGSYAGALSDGYRPKARYAIFPILSGSSPYNQSGTIWLYDDGTIDFYGVPNGGFIHGVYICQ